MSYAFGNIINYGSSLIFGNNGNDNKSENTQSSSFKKESGQESEDFSLLNQLITDIESLTEQNKKLTTRIAQLECSPEKKTDTQPKDKDKDPDDFSKISLIPHPNIRLQAAQIASEFPDEILYDTGTRKTKDQTIDLTFESTLQELQQRNNQQQQEKEELEIQKTNLQAQLKEAQEALEKAKLEKDQQQEELSAYKDSFEKNIRETEEAKNAQQKTETELQTKQLQEQELKEKLRKQEIQIEDLSVEIEAKKEKANAVIQILATQDATLKENEIESSKMKTQISHITAEAERVEKMTKVELATEREQKTALQNELSKIKKQTEKQNDTLIEMQRTITRQRLEIQENKVKIQEVDSLQRQLSTLQSEFNRHKELNRPLTTNEQEHAITRLAREKTTIEHKLTVQKAQLDTLRSDRLGMTGGLLLLGGLTSLIIGTAFCPALLPVTIAAIKISLPFLIASGAMILSGLALSAKALHGRISSVFFNNENLVQNTISAEAAR